MIIHKDIDFGTPLTPEQEKLLETLCDAPATPDEECPALTDEQLAQFRKASEEHRKANRKQTITLRLSPQAARTARALGKGYTSVLSRILEAALSDGDTIRRFL